MSDLTIEKAIDKSTPIICEGEGLMLANALMAAGQAATPVTRVGLNGIALPPVSPQEILTVPDPEQKYEIGKATPQMVMGTSGPGLSGPRA